MMDHGRRPVDMLDQERESSRLLIPIFFAVLGLVGYIVVSFGNISVTSETTLVLVLAAVVYLLTFIDLRIGLALTIISIGSSFEFTFGGINNLRLEDFIIPVIFLSWLTRVIDKKEPFEPSSLKVPMMLVVFFAAISSLKSISIEQLPIKQAFFNFGKMAEYFLLFIIYLNNVKEEREARTFILITVLASFAVSVMGVYEFYIGGQIKISGPEGETSNILGGYVIFHIAIILGILLASDISTKMRFILLVALGMNVLTLLYTLSRTSYIALMGGLIVLGLRKPKFFVYVLLIVVVVPLIVSSDILTRMNSIFEIFGPKPPSSYQARMVAVKSFGSKIPGNPILGRGMGAVAQTVDNEYVKRALELGILGLMVFLWMLLNMLRTGNSAYLLMREKRDIFSGFALGYFAGVVCLIVHGFGATTFTTIRTMEALMAYSGIMCAIYNRYPEWQEQHRKMDQAESLFEPFKMNRAAMFQGK